MFQVKRALNVHHAFIGHTHSLYFRWLIAAFSLLFTTEHISAANGDYRSIATGNWTSNATWQADYGAGWVAASAGDYPGKNAGTGAVTIQNNTIVTLDASIPNPLGSLAISGTANNTALTYNGSGAWSLTVTGATTIELLQEV
ncbi:MAG: hypothetical protein U0X76_11045 [Bacteroidia bacterium]